MPSQDYILPLLVLVPLAAALVMLLPVPFFNDRHNAWHWAMLGSLATFILSLHAAWRFDFFGAAFGTSGAGGGYQLAGVATWVPGFGLAFGWGADSISMWLILLSTFLMPIVVLASLTAVTERTREYYFWLLLIEAAMIGTFVATDILFFYVCFEFTLVPLYFLIGVFGSKDRLRAARVFFLYTFTGSMLTFAGILYVAWKASQASGDWTFDILALHAAGRAMSDAEQAWVFLSLMAGFAVKVPIWPVHTWLPLAHTEAPTAGSVILAGVLLKLGTYGILRFAVPMCPAAIVQYAPHVGVLAVCGIVITALICWVQSDIKKLIAYSSVSHLGFCVLGLFALDDQRAGAVGSVMYMINHGLSTGAMFLCIGMIYERFHTREMARMSGLARALPVWSFFMVYFVLASVGLPGLNGFVGEFLTLLGAFHSPPEVLGFEYAAVAGLGLIFGAIYLLYMVGKVIFGPLHLPDTHHPATPTPEHRATPSPEHPATPSPEHREGLAHAHAHPAVADLSAREIIVLAPIAVACLVLGLVPHLMLDTLEEPVAALTAPAEQLAREPAELVRAEPAVTLELQLPGNSQ